MPPAGVSFEDGAVLGEGDLPRGVLHRLPVGVVGAALHVVDLLAIQFERDAEFDDGLTSRCRASTPSAGASMLRRCPVPTADSVCRRALHVHHAPAGEVALEGAGRLLLDLGPGRIGDRGQFAVQVIHAEDFL